MKLEPVTKFDKRNKRTSKKIGDSVMSAYCHAIVIFPIYGQFRAIHLVCKTYISINSNLLSYKK